MWSDVLTKPLQGQQFRMMRAMLMNWPKDYDEMSRQYQIDNTNKL